MTAEKNRKTNSKSLRKIVFVGIAVALIFVLVGAFVLSYSMETLDKQADKLGAKEKPVWNAPFADYNVSWLENAWGSLIAGAIGVTLLFVISYGVASLLKRKNRHG
ncbi:MAG TPA: PDGLE domain-containing protein [candidate division Zixibacteria bacterium]|nr:PDGLE domain-containing protein [candidate division Zixibacteria bacterium]